MVKIERLRKMNFKFFVDIIFVILMFLVALAIGSIIFQIVKSRLKKEKYISSAIFCFISISIFFIFLLSGHAIKQFVFNESSKYENPKQEKRIQESLKETPPTEKEIEDNKEKMDNYSDNIHKKSINEYEENMSSEYEKIKEKNK